MKLFENINREYTPGINLDVLDKTYNTLEVGHQKAIEASSALKTEIAKLPMNEAEDGFKQQLVNEIQNTIEANTIYGNSYGALDDLVLASGNIASDGRVIGRLRSQQAYLDYQKKIDSSDISEGMKQMYKEENPYYYVDGDVDERTGKISPGEKWEANTNPVKTIDFYTVMNTALKNAAIDKGGGETIMFLDENGNPTTDYRKSLDGHMYKSVGSTWEKLSEESIKKAVYAARKSIAGLEESLQQDYRYELWKNKKQNGNNISYVEGLTDKDGNILDYESWVNHKIDRFADASKYTHVKTNVSMGTALQNYKQYVANAQNSENPTKLDITTPNKNNKNKNNKGDNKNNNYLMDPLIAGPGVINKVKQNTYAIAINAKDVANKEVLTLLKNKGYDTSNINNISDIIQATKNNNNYGPGNTINTLLQSYNFTPEEKRKLNDNIWAYYYNNREIAKIKNEAKKKELDVDALDFSSNVNNQTYSSSNKYGRQINNKLNDMLANDELTFVIGKNVFNTLKNKYKVNNLKDVGIDWSEDSDGRFVIKFDGHNRNLLPMFASNIIAADDENSGYNFANFVKDAFTNVTDDNYQIISKNHKRLPAVINTVGSMFTLKPHRIISSNMDIIDGANTYGNKLNLESLARIYNDALAKGSDVENKFIGESNYTNKYEYSYDSFTEKNIKRNLSLGYIDNSEAKSMLEDSKNQIDNLFKQNKFDTNNSYIIDSGFSNEYKGSPDNLKNIISYMYRNHPKDVIRSVNTNYGYMFGNENMPTSGYLLTLNLTNAIQNNSFKSYINDDDNLKDITDNTLTVLLLNPIKEEYDESMSVHNQIVNRFVVANTTDGIVENSGTVNGLGDTNLYKITNDKYETNFMGKHIVLNEDYAQNLSENIYELELVKYRILNDLIDENSAINVINNIRNNIITLTNIPENIVNISLNNYLTSDYEN